MITIRDETAADRDAVRHVNEQAFGRADEADLVDALRAGGYVQVSLVAQLDGRIVGHILFSDLSIESETGSIDALALAPMAILPAYQRQGIGSELVREGLATSLRRGHRAVVVLGHPDFYPRFGFSAEIARPLSAPFSGEAWMALELVPGALHNVSGRVIYAPPFGIA